MTIYNSLHQHDSYQVSVRSFLKFLVDQKDKYDISENKELLICILRETVSYWINSYRKDIANRRMERKYSTLDKLITNEDIDEYLANGEAVSAIKLLDKCASISTPILQQQQLVLMRNFLMVLICLVNAHRSECLQICWWQSLTQHTSWDQLYNLCQGTKKL